MTISQPCAVTIAVSPRHMRLSDLSTREWPPIAADPGGIAERVPRQLGAVGEPYALGRPELVDQRLQHGQPRGSADVLGVEDQHREPAHLVDAAKLVSPHGEHGRRRENLSIEVGAKAERKERTIVEDPGCRQLDESRRTRVAIGPQRVLQIACVEEPVLTQQVDGRVCDLVERRAIANGWNAGNAREDKKRLLGRVAASPVPLLGNMFGSVDSFA